MDIKIWDDKYRIKSDTHQYILTKVAEEGKTTDIDIGYFGTLSHLFKSLAEREGRLNKCRTLEGYVKHIEEVNKELEKNVRAIAAMIGVNESFERVMNCMAEDLPASMQEIGETKKKVK